MDKLKVLQEKRAALHGELQALLDAANAEERALTDEESAKFDDLEKQITNIDRTIAAEERARKLALPDDTGSKDDGKKSAEDVAAAEERAFADYIRGVVSEDRADDVDLKLSENGAVIPTSIANKIIEKVYDLCPIYQLADKITAGGNVTIPYYDEETNAITMAYANEFEELSSTSGKFTSIDLKGYLAGVLTKISKSLINNSQFDIVNFVIDHMAEAISKWIEKELLVGTSDKIDGISKAKQSLKIAGEELTPDDLIDLQETIPDAYQGGCVWLMNKATRTFIRKFKDHDGDYILNKDMTGKWGYTLFGKPVYCTDQLPKLTDKEANGKPVIVYGDMKGLIVKTAESMNIEVLRERFATEHVVGVVGWLEMDAKIQNEQMIAVLKASSGE